MAQTDRTASQKVGDVLVKALGIKRDYRNPLGLDPVTRGESTFSTGTTDTYVEEEPHSLEYLLEFVPTVNGIFRYFYNLFPFLRWITRYNLQWFMGDLVAGMFHLDRISTAYLMLRAKEASPLLISS